MSEVDPVAMNVPVDTAPTPQVTAIRDAIMALIPKDPNIVTNVSLHDGLIDISVRWRSLRFNATETIAGRDADTIGLQIDQKFRDWLRGTVKNMKTVPKHGRVVADMTRWLKDNPDKKTWLYGKESDAAEAV